MSIEDALYSVGELVDSCGRWLRQFIFPRPSKEPPSFKHLRRLIKRDLTVHEFLSLTLQLAFIFYLVVNLILLLLRLDVLWILLTAPPYFLYIRYVIVRNREFFLEPEPYKMFYYWISGISFASFAGYTVIRIVATTVYYYMGYLAVILGIILLFRHYFRSRYGREWTYGTVEEVKGDAARVFVHDDLAANVKPGYYWVDAVPEAKPGRVVKLLIENRALKGAVPVRILEVYIGGQSSQTETEPNDAAE